jgi:hypothetical protein
MQRALRAGGFEGAHREIERAVTSIRSVCLLPGCRSASDLARAPRHLGAPLRTFLEDLGLS